MMKQIIFGLSLALSCSAAPAQDEWGFDDWDSNTDGAISEAEFGEGLEEADLYARWDTNDDGVLSEEEVDTGLFAYWDRDNNGILSEEEWNDVAAEELEVE